MSLKVVAECFQGHGHLVFHGFSGNSQCSCNLFVGHALLPAHTKYLFSFGRQRIYGILRYFQQFIVVNLFFCGEVMKNLIGGEAVQIFPFIDPFTDKIKYFVFGNGKDVAVKRTGWIQTAAIFPELSEYLLYSAFCFFTGFEESVRKTVKLLPVLHEEDIESFMITFPDPGDQIPVII